MDQCLFSSVRSSPEYQDCPLHCRYNAKELHIHLYQTFQSVFDMIRKSLLPPTGASSRAASIAPSIIVKDFFNIHSSSSSFTRFTCWYLPSGKSLIIRTCAGRQVHFPFFLILQYSLPMYTRCIHYYMNHSSSASAITKLFQQSQQIRASPSSIATSPHSGQGCSRSMFPISSTPNQTYRISSVKPLIL